jgi:acetyl-CoA carboxylase biotin carboxyl carrier protein
MAQKKIPSKAEDARAAGRDSRVDLGEIERILEFMTAHGLEELEYRSGDLQVRLRRQSTGGASAFVPAVAVAHAPVEQAAARASAPAVPGAPAAPAGEDLHIVKSPIVGTFYSAPAPDAPPFVQPGDSVKRGQILCIVEAMKLMNEIEADQAGEVVRQLAENGQPVEYGQPLFALRPLAEA